MWAKRLQPFPIFWLRVPRNVMRHLRTIGFHDGLDRDKATDVNRRIFQAFHPKAPVKERDRQLRDWSSDITRACTAMKKQYPVLWNPAIPETERERLKGILPHLIEVQGTTIDEALHNLAILKWSFGIFYHVACMGNWKEVTISQLRLLRRVGLDGIHVSLLGTREDRAFFVDECHKAEIECEVDFFSSDLLLYETPGIRLVADWATENPHGYLMYFHTKGVSVPNDYVKTRWRKLMELWVIERWKKNIELLRGGADAVGASWRRYEPIQHFPGNYFMARSSFIAGLEPFEHFYFHPRHAIHNSSSWRFQSEFWIGSFKREPNIESVFAFDEPMDRLSAIIAL